MVIELKENTSVKNIKILYNQLLDLIDKENEIIFDLKKMKRIDLSLVQVFFALNNELKSSGKKMILKSVPENIKNQLFLTGFINKKNPAKPGVKS